MALHYPEQYRIGKGEVASAAGRAGMFWIPPGRENAYPLQARASVADGWEHVAVVPAIVKRCPTWEEMALVRRLFWDGEDCVVQYHPPESEYVNDHARCLHLWRPVSVEFPRPPTILVARPLAYGPVD